MQEVWKSVVEFEGLYQVSNLGNFRRDPAKQTPNKYRKPKPLERKTHLNRLGYLYATLCKQNVHVKRTIHQLVAVAFIPNAKYGDIVNHLDGNKLNNAVTNLEITTTQGNNLHAHKIGLMPKPGSSVYHNVHIVREKYKDKIYTYYAAKIKNMGKIIFNKQFTCEIEAAKAVDAFLDSIEDTQRKRNFPKP